VSSVLSLLRVFSQKFISRNFWRLTLFQRFSQAEKLTTSLKYDPGKRLNPNGIIVENVEAKEVAT
ncbi:unnamed protein product, partial [Brassica oleracea var. botrytis]